MQAQVKTLLNRTQPMPGFCYADVHVVDKLLPHLHPAYPLSAAEGLRTSWQRSTLLVLAITLHNVRCGPPLRRMLHRSRSLDTRGWG